MSEPIEGDVMDGTAVQLFDTADGGVVLGSPAVEVVGQLDPNVQYVIQEDVVSADLAETSTVYIPQGSEIVYETHEISQESYEVGADATEVVLADQAVEYSTEPDRVPDYMPEPIGMYGGPPAELMEGDSSTDAPLVSTSYVDPVAPQSYQDPEGQEDPGTDSPAVESSGTQDHIDGAGYGQEVEPMELEEVQEEQSAVVGASMQVQSVHDVIQDISQLNELSAGELAPQEAPEVQMDVVAGVPSYESVAVVDQALDDDLAGSVEQATEQEPNFGLDEVDAVPQESPSDIQQVDSLSESEAILDDPDSVPTTEGMDPVPTTEGISLPEVITQDEVMADSIPSGDPEPQQPSPAQEQPDPDEAQDDLDLAQPIATDPAPSEDALSEDIHAEEAATAQSEEAESALLDDVSNISEPAVTASEPTPGETIEGVKALSPEERSSVLEPVTAEEDALLDEPQPAQETAEMSPTSETNLLQQESNSEAPDQDATSLGMSEAKSDDVSESKLEENSNQSSIDQVGTEEKSQDLPDVSESKVSADDPLEMDDQKSQVSVETLSTTSDTQKSDQQEVVNGEVSQGSGEAKSIGESPLAKDTQDSNDALSVKSHSTDDSKSSTSKKAVKTTKKTQPVIKTKDESPVEIVDDDDDVKVIATEKKRKDVAPKRAKSTESNESAATKSEPSSAKTDKSPAKQPQTCIVCQKVGKCKYNIVRNGDIKHLCDDECFKKFRARPTSYLRSEKEVVLCDACKAPVSDPAQFKLTLNDGTNKVFCRDLCIKMFKAKDYCVYCGKIDKSSFMSAINKDGVFKCFCSHACLNKYQKAPKDDDDIEIVGTSQIPKKKKGPQPIAMGPGPKQSSGLAMTTRQIICTVCKEKKPIKHEVNFNRKMNSLCSDKCFAAFRYANKLTMSPCDNCGAFCSDSSATNSATESIQFEGCTKKFCGTYCMNSFKNKKRKIIPCAWCNTKKNNFEMVERVDASNKVQLFCTLNCLSLYRVNLQATSNQRVKCDQCNMMAPAQYHLTMSDASVRNFCTYNCVISFQSQFNNSNKQAATPQKQAVPNQRNVPANVAIQQSMLSTSTKTTRQSARVAAKHTTDSVNADGVPIISDVVSLAQAVAPPPVTVAPPQRYTKPVQQVSTGTGMNTITQHIIIEPPKPKQVRNKALLCKPYCQTKATSCRPHTQHKETQTDGEPEKKPILVPIPVPIYVPVPMAMYSFPQPYPMPMPVPIPVPCFIPTTKKSSESILRHIKEIQERIPADPFEAELLMLAEAVEKADKSGPETSSSEEEEEAPPLPPPPPKTEPMTYQEDPEDPGTTGALGEDMLQMALRMASEISEEPVLDLEDTLRPNPVQPSESGFQRQFRVEHQDQSQFSTIDENSDILTSTSPRSSPRSKRRGRGRGRGRQKRARYDEDPNYQPEDGEEATEVKPVISDENMVLKYSYGVNAWKHWVVQKNTQLEKAGGGTRRKLKLFKTDLLACTADELNYSLCLFVKEVRKPNGEVYACDSIFYLCLGIQQYLYENGRIDNIFTDFYYERFTECLNEVLLGYEVRLNAQGLIVCRIEEEHLWESKQLGAHSPYILLNTLIYFNTKYFHLKSPEDHVKLSFSHIMKHWKRANGQPVSSKSPATSQGAKSVYLRYYAPVAHAGADPGQKRKREEAPVYEQGENTENPLRCPVKLYEFYLSKCPESIKNRNDVFYLVPERSCVPDSPVWYSTGALGTDTMMKMLNRLRVVREIQECYLQNHPMFV